LALLVRRRRLLDAEPVRPRGRLAVVDEDERTEQLDRVGVRLRLPLREGGAEVEVACSRRGAGLVVALALLAAGLRRGVVGRGGRLAPLALALCSLRLGGSVRLDLVDQP